ncbi:MAG: methylenetetrahydrofolate reductase [NAD(P)H] [bacterium]
MTATNRVFSMELFPPKTEAGTQSLQQAVTRMQALKPAYFSVTYGAGGSTQERTFATVDWLREQQQQTVPHLSCVGMSKTDINEILERYADQGINRVVALRGDLPSGVGPGNIGELNYANELVAHIKDTFGDRFAIEVAAYPEFHPEALSAAADLDNFKRKVDAGADGAITQYFYNPDAYFRFVEACQGSGVDIPIVPGIMPITNYTSLARFSDACGAEIPRWIRKRLESYGDDLDSIVAFGRYVVCSLSQQLLDNGAPGLHFYTMNRADPVTAIWQDLGLPD